MKIFWDITKSHRQRHHSGLLRVSRRLFEALRTRSPDDVVPVVWDERPGKWMIARRGGFRRPASPVMNAGDWWISPEVFAPEERPGWQHWMDQAACRKAMLFHDLIPVTHPDITWPHSVRRHPDYLRMLNGMDHLFSPSRASTEALLDYFRQEKCPPGPPVTQLTWGANAGAEPRAPVRRHAGPPRQILQLGILEPRKNQRLLLQAMDAVWRRHPKIRVVFCGRVNPHFGKPVVRAIREAARARRPVEHFDSPEDRQLRQILEHTDLTAFPTRAEGAGLPLVESLWSGIPVVASDIPPLREYGEAGGCRFFSPGDADALAGAILEVADSGEAREALWTSLEGRSLPTWDDTASQLLKALESG